MSPGAAEADYVEVELDTSRGRGEDDMDVTDDNNVCYTNTTTEGNEDTYQDDSRHISQNPISPPRRGSGQKNSNQNEVTPRGKKVQAEGLELLQIL